MHRIFTKPFYFIVLTLCLGCLPVHAAERFRGAWIATVANIDWPSAEAVGNTEKQKQAMKEAHVDYDYQSAYEITFRCLARLLEVK